MSPDPDTLRLLYLTREPHPSLRPDLQVLFGRELPRQGVMSDLVAVGDPQAPWPAGRRHVLAATTGWQRRLADWRLMLDLPALARGPIDAVQARDRFFGAWWALLAARRAGKPFYYWMSLPFPEAWLQLATAPTRGRRGPRAWAYRLRWGLRGMLAGWILFRYVLPRADHVFAQSRGMADALAARGIAQERITSVPMGVDMQEMRGLPLPRDPRLRGRRYVVYLGALEAARQPQWMLEAFARVRAAHPDLLLVLAGDSQDSAERAWLRGEVVRFGLEDHVLQTGWLAPQAARAYVCGAVLALAHFPRGRVEDQASPTKVSEYLALGVPVVATDQPDQAALMGAAGGGVVVPASVEGLVQGMISVLADPDRFRAEAAAARAYIELHRSYAAIAGMVSRRYLSLVKASSGPMTARD